MVVKKNNANPSKDKSTKKKQPDFLSLRNYF